MNIDCLTLTIYFSEADRCGGVPAGDALLELCARHEVEVAVLVRGSEGFGRNHEIHTDRFVESAYDLPVTLTAVGERSAIEPLLPQVRALITSGTVTLADGRLLRRQTTPLTPSDPQHRMTRLTLYFARSDDIGDVPAYRAVVDQLHACGVPGAAVLLGFDGTFQGRRERAGILTKRPRSPLMIVSVGRAQEIAKALPAVTSMLPHAIMSLESVRVCKQDGTLLSRPEKVAAHGQDGYDVLQKLVVYSGVHTRYKHHPLDAELVRALLRAPVDGATVYRGIWGYAHDDPPHGLRTWSLLERVPTVTVVVEQAADIEATFAIIDKLTESSGLVTSETVRGYHANPRPGRQRRSLRDRLHLGNAHARDS